MYRHRVLCRVLACKENNVVTDSNWKVLTAEEFEALGECTWKDIARLKATVKYLMAVERASRCLVKYQPGVYSYIESTLNNLDARRNCSDE